MAGVQATQALTRGSAPRYLRDRGMMAMALSRSMSRYSCGIASALIGWQRLQHPGNMLDGRIRVPTCDRENILRKMKSLTRFKKKRAENLLKLRRINKQMYSRLETPQS